MLKEVGWAVIDYIRHGRPVCYCPQVFIRHLAPIGPFSDQDHLHQIVVKHARVAHVPISEKRRHGMHSLRHSLATKLMEDGTPVEQIADILGHQSTQSTGVYLKSSLGVSTSASRRVRPRSSSRPCCAFGGSGSGDPGSGDARRSRARPASRDGMRLPERCARLGARRAGGDQRLGLPPTAIGREWWALEPLPRRCGRRPYLRRCDAVGTGVLGRARPAWTCFAGSTLSTN